MAKLDNKSANLVPSATHPASASDGHSPVVTFVWLYPEVKLLPSLWQVPNWAMLAEQLPSWKIRGLLNVNKWASTNQSKRRFTSKKTHLKNKNKHSCKRKQFNSYRERCRQWNCPAEVRLTFIKKPQFPYSCAVTQPSHTADKPPQDHYFPSGMERGQTETGTWKNLPPIINWRRSSWCQRSSLGRAGIGAS